MGFELRVDFRLPNRLLIAVALTTFTSFGCSQGSDIRLQGPEKPTAPAPTTPSSETPTENPDGTPAENPGDRSSNSSDPKPPNPPPNAAPADPLYRMFCDDRYPPYLNAISSMASSSGFGARIDVGELDANGKYDPQVDRSLEYHEHSQIVRLPKFGEARVLFSARRVPKAGNYYSKPRFVFVSDIDITSRVGIATEVAPEIAPSAALKTYAENEMLSVRTFGASDQGRFLLIGQADGYRLVDLKTLKTLGTVKSGSVDSNVNPELRESDMIFSVGGFKGGSFESKLYSIGLTSTGTLKSATLVASVAGLRRPLQSIGPNPGESFAALDSKNRIVTVSPLRSGAKAVKVQGVPLKGRLSSAMTAWRDSASNEIHAVVVFEHFTALRGGITNRYKIEQVFVRVVNVDETSLSADGIVPDFDYPPDARLAVEQGSSMYRQMGAGDMMTAPDGKAIFGLFPGGLANNVYRLTASGFTRVSQFECSRLDVGVEAAGARP